MSRSLEEFLKEPTSHKPQTCPKCGHSLDLLDKEGNYRIGGEAVCQDCYFGELGEVADTGVGKIISHGGCA